MSTCQMYMNELLGVKKAQVDGSQEVPTDDIPRCAQQIEQTAGTHVREYRLRNDGAQLKTMNGENDGSRAIHLHHDDHQVLFQHDHDNSCLMASLPAAQLQKRRRHCDRRRQQPDLSSSGTDSQVSVHL